MQFLINKTIKILEKLNQCKPRKFQNTSLENKAKAITNWLLILSLISLAITVVYIVFHGTEPPSANARLFVLFTTTTSSILASLALIAPIIASLPQVFRWEQLAFDGLCDDIRHEQDMPDTGIRLRYWT